MRPSVLIGATIAAAGALMMAGWLLEVQAIVRVLPGFLMVFNTALGFAVAGGALSAGALAPGRRKAAQAGAGLVLATLGALVLAQHVLGASLGIDWPGLHTRMIDPGSNPSPGRMSPATCVGFMLVGAVLLLAPRARGTAQMLAVRVLTAALALLGLLAVAGYVLDLPDILDAYWLAQVSLPTAMSFILLALGLWLDWRGEPWNAQRLIRGEDDRIALAGTLVLAGCIVTTGTVVFWLMLSQMEHMLAADLGFALKSRRAMVAGVIQRAVEQAADVGARPNIQRLYGVLSERPGDADTQAFLKTVAASTLKSGFSVFAFVDAEGRELARAGDFLAASDLRIPLPQAFAGRRADLLWDGSFVLDVRADVVAGGIRLGEARGQHRLAELGSVMTDTADLSATSEFGLCGLRAGKLHCAPTRFQPRVFDIPAVAGGNRLPMSYALEGYTGVLKLADYRGKRVLAAYTPLGATGAGLVLKADLSDLYAPIRERLGYLVLTLVLASAAGGWILRSSVRPLARRLVHSEVRLRMALESSDLAVWDWDVPSGRVSLSEHWAAVLGGVPQTIDTSSGELARLMHPGDMAAVGEQVSALLKGTISHYAIDHRVRTYAGEWKWIRSRGRVVERARDGSALRATGTNVDINERKVSELQLAHRAAHDVLTGLPNRGLFHDRLDRALLRSRRGRALMAVIYLDVDKFKGVNDTLGHAAGDALLKEFAARLTACVRATDTVARFGGDEFAVILEGLGAREDGLRIAAAIVAAMRAPFALEGKAASVSASAGIAFHDGAAECSIEALLEAADQALYEAKAAGRDRYCVASLEISAPEEPTAVDGE